MAETRLVNFNTCCRLCLSDTMDNLKSIFDESVDDRGLQQKISASLGVEIMADDKLSTMVCQQCIEKINNWQSFKVSCSENQTKLEQWMNMSNSEMSEMNIQIKEEPIDHEVLSPDVVINGDIPMKNEPVEEEYNDLPPPLTPQGTEGDVEIVVHSPGSQMNNNDDDDPRKCELCGKVFSSSGNRKKHQRMIHGIKSYSSATESDGGSLSQDERSQSSIDSQSLSQNESTTESKETTIEEKKILFAAGLKLLQRNSTPPISSENLSKIENSYIEKCKAMVNMYRSLKCACHNVTHPNLKGLLSHLRSLRIWFPVFTCYHCMITFTDRSSSTKHYLRCPKSNLETLIKLSNLKKRSEVKTRLYQNYKCTQCRYMYSFHEDFCIHIDEDHANITLPYKCSCERVFNSLEDYKDHAYVSCMVEFYCDVCFITVKTLDAFQKHAVEAHDGSEGFILLQDDNYKQRKNFSLTASRSSLRVKREHTDESNIITGKRRSSFKPSIIESDDVGDGKVINPVFIHKIPGTKCPVCSKEYSSNNNMWRHYKMHFQENQDEPYDDSLYCCPDCGGMFNTAEWEKHKEMHKKKACNECGKVFQFQSELDQHRSVHLNLKLYRDSKTQSYKSTMLSPNSGSNIVMMCEICDSMFTTKEQLKEHKLTHETLPPVLESADSTESEEPKVKKFSCKLCNKHYSGYGGLWDHNRKKHPENKSPHSGDFPKQCKYCDKLFFTGGSYFMHKQMHERNNAVPKKHTEVSKSQPPNEDEVNDEDAESYHTCKRCFKVFSTKSNLKNHMKSHGLYNVSPSTKGIKKTLKKVWCDICHCAFENVASLEKHKAQGHCEIDDGMPTLSDEQSEGDLKVPFVFTCDVCVQTFTTKMALKKHKERHAREVRPIIKSKPNPVYCKYCKITFANPNQLSNHMREEHMEGVRQKPKERARQYTCKLCGKCFTSVSAMYAHQGWHKRGKYDNSGRVIDQTLVKVKDEPKVPVEPPQFQCSTCSACLPNDTALQIHILEKHRNVNATVLPARCTMCNLDFGSQEEYDQHKRFHAMVDKQSKRTFPCTHCPAAFSKVENLKTHIKQFHQPQEYKCPQCDRVFEKPNSLSIHLKVHEKQRMITGAKPATTVHKVISKPLYSCSICNKGFDLPKDLRTHTIQAHPF